MQNCGYNCTYQMTPEANYNATKRGAVADTDIGVGLTVAAYSVAGSFCKAVSSLPLSEQKNIINSVRNQINKGRLKQGQTPLVKTFSKTIKSNMKNPKKLLKTFAKFAKWPLIVCTGLGLVIDLMKNIGRKS